VDWRLQGTSSWANLASGRDRQVPAGWAADAGAAADESEALSETGGRA